MQKLKILFVTEYYPPHIGGVESFFFELRKALVARGHCVDVVTSSQKGASLIERDAGGSIYRVRVPRVLDRYFFSAFAMAKVTSLARNADLIHTTTYNAVLPAWMASKIMHKRAVLSVHEVLDEDWANIVHGGFIKAGILRFFEKISLNFSFDSVVAVSKFTQNRLPANLKKKSKVIYHGIDASFRKLGEGSEAEFHSVRSVPNVLFFGRASKIKGLWFLLEVIPEFLSETNFKGIFTLMISGSKSEIDKVRKFISEKNLESIVKVKQPVKRTELPLVINSASAVIVPSLAEGFGFSAAEASACGVPVIASDAGSLPEIVSGRHLFFEKGNKKSLIAVLKRAVKDDFDYKKRMSFSWEKAADEFEKVYKDLL